MPTQNRLEHEEGLLELILGTGDLPVSYLSSVLRSIQAALREVARTADATREEFQRQPQPVLMLSSLSVEDGLTLRFAFVDPLDSTPMEKFSSQAFQAFIDEFTQFLKRLPQRGLWGETYNRARRKTHDSEITRRLDQVHIELRRFYRSTLRYRGQAIHIEGDQLQIG